METIAFNLKEAELYLNMYGRVTCECKRNGARLLVSDIDQAKSFFVKNKKKIRNKVRPIKL